MADSNIKLSQFLRNLSALTPQDITTARTGPYVDVSGAQRLLAIATTAPVAPGSTVTIGFMQALDTSGTGAKVLGVPTVLTAPAAPAPAASLAPVEEAQISDLDIDNGYSTVAVTLVSNNGSALQAAAILVLGDNRFNP